MILDGRPPALRLRKVSRIDTPCPTVLPR